MVAEAVVQKIFEDTRAFYKGEIKSSNKGYDRGTNTSYENYTTKEKTRNANVVESGKLEGARRDLFKGQTMYEIGDLLHKRNTKDGNCGEMAAVAMFIAISNYQVSRDEAVHVTAYNRSHTKFFDGRGLMSGGSNLEFGHSWLRLGPQDSDGWIVDPWASVCCRESQQEETTLETLSRWAGANKRVKVHWKDGAGEKYATWTIATDGSIKALFGKGATHEFWYPDEKKPR